jgi:hypothetical protein
VARTGRQASKSEANRRDDGSGLDWTQLGCCVLCCALRGQALMWVWAGGSRGVALRNWLLLEGPAPPPPCMREREVGRAKSRAHSHGLLAAGGVRGDGVRGSVVQAEEKLSWSVLHSKVTSRAFQSRGISNSPRSPASQHHPGKHTAAKQQIQHSKPCQNAATFEAAAVAVDAVEAVETGEVVAAEPAAKTVASARRRISLILTSTWTRL